MTQRRNPDSPSHSAIDAAAGTSDVTLVAASHGRRIRVYRMLMVSSAAADLTFKSGSTALSGAVPFAAGGGIILDGQPGDFPWLITAPGEALVLSRSASTALDGFIGYSVETA